MQHSDDLLVTFLQRLHHPDRMAYVGLTLGRGIYLATMSSRRKFECDGKLGSVRGHTDIFGSAPDGPKLDTWIAFIAPPVTQAPAFAGTDRRHDRAVGGPERGLTPHSSGASGPAELVRAPRRVEVWTNSTSTPVSR